MKNIVHYDNPKYATDPRYSLVEEGIYLDDNPPDEIFSESDVQDSSNQSPRHKYRYGSMLTSDVEPPMYVTSLAFEQESEHNEGDSPSDISQYPLEDILDKYLVHVSDFYESQNAQSNTQCYLEFASPSLENIQQLRSIIGKHVYNYETDGKIGLAIE